MATTRVTVTTHGRFFVGDAKPEVRRFMDDSKEKVAKRAEDEVKARLGSSMKNPTGHYTGQIRTERKGRFNDLVVRGDTVAYGPWLESGKYSPPRRFKGYNAFRKTRTSMRNQVTSLVQSDLNRLIARLNS